MLPRVVALLGAWIAALVWLPTGWVALALIAWVAPVWPGVAVVHRGFQNVPNESPEAG